MVKIPTAVATALTAGSMPASTIQTGPRSSLLIVGRPASPRQYPAAVALAAIRESGLALIAERTLRDGRTAIEFGTTLPRDGGIAALCGRNVSLGLDQLASQGWDVA